MQSYVLSTNGNTYTVQY